MKNNLESIGCFNVPARIEGGERKCPKCNESTLREIDWVESAGGSGDNVTTFYSCRKCDYREKGETFFTNDY